MTKRRWTGDELWDLLQRLMERVVGSWAPLALAGHRAATCLILFPWNRKLIRRVRWFYVRQAFARKMVPKAAYDYAATLLKGTRAGCGPDMMRKNYEAVEKTKG